MIKDKISFKEFKDHITQRSNVMSKSIGLALIRLGNASELEAKKNVKANFGGRNNYTLSGKLMNSIYHRLKVNGNNLSMFIGSQGVVYARIHEQAADGVSTKVEPKNAKYLWVRTPESNKKSSLYRRLTPSEFYVGAKNSKLTGYYYGRSKRGNLFAMINESKTTKAGKIKTKKIPIFALRDEVNIPQRPYLMPALMFAKKKYPTYYREELYKLMGGT